MNSSLPSPTVDGVCVPCVLSSLTLSSQYYYLFMTTFGNMKANSSLSFIPHFSPHTFRPHWERRAMSQHSYPLKDMETCRIACWLLHSIKTFFAICSPPAAGLLPSHGRTYLVEWKCHESRVQSSLLQFCGQIYLALQTQRHQICPFVPALQVRLQPPAIS